MTAKPYAVLDEPAVHLTLGGGNSVTAERYHGYYSVSWTTRLNGPVALARLSSVIPAEDNVEYDFRDATHVALRALVPDLPPNCEEFSLAYSRATLAWDLDGTGHQPEITVLSPELSSPELRRLISMTGTREVRGSLERVLGRISFLWSTEQDSAPVD